MLGRIGVICLALPLLAAVGALLPSGARAAERPNIVYLLVDNVTFEHMGKRYGGENVTPAMDRPFGEFGG